jgi:hypothetical protein
MKFRSCGTNDATRRELANLRDEIGSIGRGQAVGVERDPDAWLN